MNRYFLVLTGWFFIVIFATGAVLSPAYAAGNLPPAWSEMLDAFLTNFLTLASFAGVLSVPIVLARIWRAWSVRRSSLVRGAPGWSLRRLSEVIFSKKVYSRVFEPTLTDLEKEFLEALAKRKPGHARWIQARGYFSFWAAFAAQLPVSLIRFIVMIWKATTIG